MSSILVRGLSRLACELSAGHHKSPAGAHGRDHAVQFPDRRSAHLLPAPMSALNQEALAVLYKSQVNAAVRSAATEARDGKSPPPECPADQPLEIPPAHGRHRDGRARPSAAKTGFRPRLFDDCKQTVEEASASGHRFDPECCGNCICFTDWRGGRCELSHELARHQRPAHQSL